VAKIACPRCGSDATELPAFLKNHSVAYCEHCGWNIPRATTRIRMDVHVGWALSAVGLALVMVAWRGPWGFKGALMIGAAFLLLPASMVLLGQYRLTLIKRVATGLGQTTPAPATIGLTQGNIELDRFCMTPRPRRVRMRWLGRLYVVGVGAATVLGLWLLSFMVQTLWHPPSGTAVKLVFGVVVYCGWCWICFAFFRNRIRERNLFVNGEVAMGTVATRTEGPQGAHIVYVFQAASNGAFQNRVFDFSKNQFEQMPVHVFYDPLDPSRSAALEASVYRVGR
jgi:hypothetical protein